MALTEMYDPGMTPAAGTFSARASLNVGRVRHAATPYEAGNTTVFVFVTGGRTLTGVPLLSSVERYFLSGNFWVVLALAIPARADHAAEIFSGSMFIVGGGSSVGNSVIEEIPVIDLIT